MPDILKIWKTQKQIKIEKINKKYKYIIKSLNYWMKKKEVSWLVSVKLPRSFMWCTEIEILWLIRVKCLYCFKLCLLLLGLTSHLTILQWSLYKLWSSLKFLDHSLLHPWGFVIILYVASKFWMNYSFSDLFFFAYCYN